MPTLREETIKEFGDDATKDLFGLLGCTAKSSPAELRRGYLRCSLRYHPDKGGDPNKFRVVSEVYKLFQDVDRRAAYVEDGDIVGAGEAGGDAADAEWVAYWRRIFPEVTVAGIAADRVAYVGSEDERRDVLREYSHPTVKGSLRKLLERVPHTDARHSAKRIAVLVNALIGEGLLEASGDFAEGGRWAGASSLSEKEKQQVEGDLAAAALGDAAAGVEGGAEAGEAAEALKAWEEREREREDDEDEDGDGDAGAGKGQSKRKSNGKGKGKGRGGFGRDGATVLALPSSAPALSGSSSSASASGAKASKGKKGKRVAGGAGRAGDGAQPSKRRRREAGAGAGAGQSGSDGDGGGIGASVGGMDDLAALIRGRQQARMGGLIDRLEAMASREKGGKAGDKSKGKGRGRKKRG